jgi:hypothetical protein
MFLMADYLINGQKVSDGQMVKYTDTAGNQYDAVVKQIKAVYVADIEARIENAPRFLADVPLSSESGPSSWNVPQDSAPVTSSDSKASK